MKILTGHQRNTFQYHKSFCFVAAAFVLIILGFASQVYATFPGSNGRIVFVSNQDGDEEIFVTWSDGKDPIQLTNNNASDIDPAFDRFGIRIAFASNTDGDFEIYSMNGDGSDIKQLTFNSIDDREPAWSPDGKKIVFSSNRNGNYDIFTIDANVETRGLRGSVIQLTEDVADDREPDWSPDGKQIAFTSNRDGNSNIYVMNADGNLEAQVTNNAAQDHQPSWSPVEQKIAFASNREGDEEIYVTGIGRSATSQLTDNTAEDLDPVWSPDGKQITFTSNRLGSPKIFSMTALGSGEAQLVKGVETSHLPAWSLALKLSPALQKAENVKVYSHGHFMIIEFDQRLKADKPRVELWNGDVVKFQTGGEEHSSDKKHWEIPVTHLDPYTEYELKIIMRSPYSKDPVPYKHYKPVKTKARLVTVQFRWVKVHDDGDWGDCGEFEFDFKASGKFETSSPSYVRIPAGDDFHDICDGSSWDPADREMELWFVEGNSIVVSVIGVDEDQDWLSVPYTCNTYGGCDGLGETAKGSVTLNIAPAEFTEKAEEFDHYEVINAGYGDGIDGNPRFTWHIRYFVKYELFQ
jgi:dipeptidyl aminopeptidase/acylaminoacyl peptidase